MKVLGIWQVKLIFMFRKYLLLKYVLYSQERRIYLGPNVSLNRLGFKMLSKTDELYYLKVVLL